MAQPAPQTDEGHLAAELRREREELADHCGAWSNIGNCALTVVTGHPLHVAIGSLAPKNGFGVGLALSTSYAPTETWRLGWSADSVVTPSGAWRMGGYLKLVHVPPPRIGVVLGGTPLTVEPTSLAVRPHTVINVYAQATSLSRLDFYGLGPDSERSGQSAFGLRSTVIGTHAIVPLSGWRLADRLALSATGTVNARLTSLAPETTDSSPSLQAVYGTTDLPGFQDQPTTVEFGEGLRARPSFFDEGLRLDYRFEAQQFLASSTSSFQRWTLDLSHEIPLYGTVTRRRPSPSNLPNECGTSPDSPDCPRVSFSRNRGGAVYLRALLVTSTTTGANRVPFYFQPTIGGNDVDGASTLPSYDDYRFRAPNLFLLQETFEHALWDPVGVWVRADHGMVALEPGRLSTRDLRTSLSVGVTVRAGGLPELVLSFSWGGGEGRHVSATIDNALLGGSARPPLQ